MHALDFWRGVRDELRAGAPVFVALVADHTRHSPGTRGARLWLSASGVSAGTIGGGIMEQTLLSRGEAALKWLRAGEEGGGQEADALARLVASGEARDLHHRRKGAGERSGLICAGRQTNVAFVVRPERDLVVLDEAVACLDADEAAWLVWDSGAGRLSLASRGASPEQGSRAVRCVRREGEPWRYEEQLLTLRRVAIFGGGHCGLALSRQMASLGYVVTVADTRAEVPTFVGNEAARYRVVVSDYAQAAVEVSHPSWTCAVVMTADFPSDVQALLGAVSVPFAFVGLMGAPAKLRAIFAALGEAGVSESALSRVTAPVGLPIGSSTPAEIAVSVAAQLIQERPTLFPAQEGVSR